MVRLTLSFVTSAILCYLSIAASAKVDEDVKAESLSELVTKWKQKAIEQFNQTKKTLQDILKADNVQAEIKRLMHKVSHVSHSIMDDMEDIKDRVTALGNKTVDDIKNRWENVKHKFDAVLFHGKDDIKGSEGFQIVEAISQGLHDVKEAILQTIDNITALSKGKNTTTTE